MSGSAAAQSQDKNRCWWTFDLEVLLFETIKSSSSAHF